MSRSIDLQIDSALMLVFPHRIAEDHLHRLPAPPRLSLPFSLSIQINLLHQRPVFNSCIPLLMKDMYLHRHRRVYTVTHPGHQLQRHHDVPRYPRGRVGAVVSLQIVVWWVFRDAAGSEIEDGGGEVDE